MPGIEISKCTFHDWHTGLAAPEMYNSLGFQGGDRVQLLVNKMMLDNHVNIVGEGYDFKYLLYVLDLFPSVPAFFLKDEKLKRCCFFYNFLLQTRWAGCIHRKLSLDSFPELYKRIPSTRGITLYNNLVF